MKSNQDIHTVILLIYKFDKSDIFRYTTFETEHDLNVFLNNFRNNIICVKKEVIEFTDV